MLRVMSFSAMAAIAAAVLFLSGCALVPLDEQQLGDDAAHTIMTAIDEDDMDAFFRCLLPMRSKLAICKRGSRMLIVCS